MSFQLSFIRKILSVINGKRITAKTLVAPKRQTNVFSPEKFSKDTRVTHAQIGGFPLITLHPVVPKGVHVIFFHGGSYVLEALPAHRRIAETLCRSYGMTVSLLDYPLAPEYNHKDTFRYVNNAYRYLLQTYPDDRLTFFGDSAGGGLALAFLQQLRQEEVLPLPLATVLLSPWLDASLSNPDIPEFEKKDPVLSREALLFAARTYAAGADLRHPALSPMYGPMDELGNLLLLFGTHELFYPDGMLLLEKLRNVSGTRLDTAVYEGAVHDWALFPVPEASRAIQQIADWLTAGVRET